MAQKLAETFFLLSRTESSHHETRRIKWRLTRISAEKCLIAAKYGGTTVKVGDFEVGKTNKSADFLSKFPFGKVPAYEGDGVTLSESNAIAQYRTYSKPGVYGGKSDESNFNQLSLT